MDKQKALARIRDIRGGCGINSSEIPEFIRGKFASDLIEQHDTTFMYGVEYGEIMGLIKAFDIVEGDL